MITPNGKEIQIVGDRTLYKIQFSTGGQLPKELQGLFTSHTEAKRKIDQYLEKKLNGKSTIK